MTKELKEILEESEKRNESAIDHLLTVFPLLRKENLQIDKAGFLHDYEHPSGLHYKYRDVADELRKHFDKTLDSFYFRVMRECHHEEVMATNREEGLKILKDIYSASKYQID